MVLRRRGRGLLRRATDPHRRGDPARGVRRARARCFPGRARSATATRPGSARRRCLPTASPAVVDAVVEESRAHARRAVRTPGRRGLRRRVRQWPGLAGLPRVRRRSARPGQRQRRPAPVGASSCCTPSCTRPTPATTPRAASRRWAWSADAGCSSRPSWSCRRRSRCVSEGLAELGPVPAPRRRRTGRRTKRSCEAPGSTSTSRTTGPCAAAVEPVLRIQADAGQLLHADGLVRGRGAATYLRQWALVDRRRLLEHVGPLRRRSRDTAATSSATRRASRAAASTSNGDLARFRTLLTEQVRVGDLVGAFVGTLQISSHEIRACPT